MYIYTPLIYIGILGRYQNSVTTQLLSEKSIMRPGEIDSQSMNPLDTEPQFGRAIMYSYSKQ